MGILLKVASAVGLRQSRFMQELVGRKLGPYRGTYRDTAEATAALPTARRSTYDNESLVDVGTTSFSQKHLFDWPVLYYLREELGRGGPKVVTDFGGHVGVKFYAYRDDLHLQDDQKWQVVDVPAICREGRRRTPGQLTGLRFFEDIRETEPCDILICSGAIQYSGDDPQTLIERMGHRPSVVLLNKVPLTGASRGYTTLENFGSVSIPYRIYTRQQLGAAQEALGYTLAAEWHIPDRNIGVITGAKVDWIDMIGQAWKLNT